MNPNNCTRANSIAYTARRMLVRALARSSSPRQTPVQPTQFLFRRSLATNDPSSDLKEKQSRYDALKRHQNQTESLLNTHLDNASAAKANAGRPGSDGVFYLGIRPGSRDLPKNYKQWKDLGVGGKVVRSGARVTSSIVILAGAGLTALLFYALATELGSTNSPTVIYADTCEHIAQHTGLRQLLPPAAHIKFHTSPPRSSVDRPRHRNRSVPSAITVDSAGREHLYLNFWIETSPDTSNVLTWRQLEWWDVREWDWSIDAARAWAKETRRDVWRGGKRIFALLTGQPLEQPTVSQGSQSANETPSGPTPKESESRSLPASIWASLIASLRPATTTLSGSKARQQRLVYTSGEVHVDLVRDSTNNFVYRYILVDLPNSSDAASTRVFIKRAAGVTEHESVMRFS
ncbi:hypothetical protein FRC18_004622 [Serendipita sp. 400]|nr:hypothetical protein FRC18_004622 [Serendipita sp. 400]